MEFCPKTTLFYVKYHFFPKIFLKIVISAVKMEFCSILAICLQRNLYNLEHHYPVSIEQDLLTSYRSISFLIHEIVVCPEEEPS